MSNQPDLRRLLLPDEKFEEGSYVRVRCPFHEDGDIASGAVYEDHYYCFAGSCGTWVARHKFLDHIRAGRVDVVSTIGNQDEGLAYLPQSLAEGYAALLQGPRAHRKEWLLARGLTEETIRKARLGHTGRAFTIPVFGPPAGGDEGSGERVTGDGDGPSPAPVHRRAGHEGAPPSVLRAVKYRHDPEYDLCEDECTCPKYWGIKGRNRGLLYDPSGALSGLREVRSLVLTEGELDALLLVQHGVPAVSALNGARDLTALEPLKRFAEVVIAKDMDSAGQKGALLAREALGNARIVTWYVERVYDERGSYKPAQGYPKDVTEFIQQRGIAAFRRLAKV